jgi:hypothetical protein
MVVFFDVDHDFEGLRAPKARLDTVLTKPVTPPGQALYKHMYKHVTVSALSAQRSPVFQPLRLGEDGNKYKRTLPSP